MTIPVAITLSEIKLSAFIILVFSKQKGLTIVFRNDPLESLKVSSTFDSIQFVRDYLQRTIEQQLRNLMMDELPAIIHRLSLQFWCADQAQKGTETPKEDLDDQGMDPFSSPPEDPVDSNGNLLDLNAISELTLHGGELQYLFSQKNLLRLAALTDSHRTLSLFTPGIRDVVFRAWSARPDHSDANTPAVATPSLAKTYSLTGGASTTYTFSDTGSASHGYLPVRPSLSTLNSGNIPLAAASNHRSRPGRKKKTRVVNLRRARSEAGSSDNMSDASDTASVNVPSSEPLLAPSIPEPSEDGRAASEDLPASKVRFSSERTALEKAKEQTSNDHIKSHHRMAKHAKSPLSQIQEAGEEKLPLQYAKEKLALRDNASSTSDTSSVILEQAWIMKMAGEIARRVYDEKQRQGPGEPWEEGADRPPPPAYEAAN